KSTYSSNKNKDGWDKSIFSGNRSYSKNTTNTVKDNLTGLIWQKTPNYKKYNWEKAKNYCRSLSLDGYNNWRLPNFNELFYLADRTKYNPAIDTNYFNVKTDNWYWTSTSYKNSSSRAWVVGFSLGNNRIKSDDRYDRYVRCVR
ncbi:MAG: DUF1566 domain-containing protein, partial [Campylobacterota bacterium]|nr:DUF1566 domain-containing protein [Campylobacterota bacterium]